MTVPDAKRLKDLELENSRLKKLLAESLLDIGALNEARRARAIAIGEDLQVLADYPVSKGCTSPFAPVWIAEMVRRRSS